MRFIQWRPDKEKTEATNWFLIFLLLLGKWEGTMTETKRTRVEIMPTHQASPRRAAQKATLNRRGTFHSLRHSVMLKGLHCLIFCDPKEISGERSIFLDSH